MTKEKFESALKELEGVIEKLEDESLPLEESILLYEKGVKLSRICSLKLNEAQGKIEKLSKTLKNNAD